MKRILPYLLGFILVMALVAITMSAGSNRPRRLNENVTLRQRDKIPYGFYAAYHLLPSLFPRTSITLDKNAPGDWDSISMYGSNQAVVIVAPFFGAYEYELNQLMTFVKNGNHVVIITRNMSREAQEFFNLKRGPFLFDDSGGDSLVVGLKSPPYQHRRFFSYPGKQMVSGLRRNDTLRSAVLGVYRNGNPNFMRFTAGAGSVHVHLSPLAFSNYFILHKNNIEYYRQAFSVLPGNLETIAWNEYYFSNSYYEKDPDREREPGWLSVLFRYRAFRWGLLTALAAILLFVLLGMRRRQRFIPVHKKPRNESLDFVKTIGRLYYDRRDHQNLAWKMALYFLEHVRLNYKLPTHVLDEKFREALHFKTGYPLEEINVITGFIEYLRGQPVISESELYRFHKQLETFYQNT